MFTHKLKLLWRPTHSIRFSSSITARAIVYSEYGNPIEKVKIFSHQLNNPNDNQIIIKLLAAPINPADINQVEGVYPSKPPLTTDLGTDVPSAVGGNEGVFEVVSTGSNVKSLKIGDWVLPYGGNFGTWRTHALVDESKVYKLNTSEGLTPLQVSTVSVNPITAHQMLTKFVTLQKGDWFLQNGGTSGVGRAAIQLAKIWGYKSISVIRDKPSPEIDNIKEDLLSLGADHIITENELNDRSIKQKISEWTQGKPIKLAFNCVGGKSATNVARQLAHGGQIITYGGMSKQPLTFPTSLFIFKDIVARGYWLSEWSKRDPKAKFQVTEEILDLYRNGQLKDVPLTKNIWTSESTDQELETTFKNALEASKKGKQLIQFN